MKPRADMNRTRCYCGLARVHGEPCRHGAPPEADRQHLQVHANKRKANSQRAGQRTGGYPTYREVQDAAARVAPLEERHRAFWSRRRRASR